MHKLIIEDKSIINEEEKNKINYLIEDIPFYWSKFSTSEKFPFFSHSLVNRPKNDEMFNKNSKIEINSEYFEFFYSLIKKFCEKHNINYSNIIRASLNSTFHIPGYPYLDPHVDFSKPHIVVIIYLNELCKSSPTLIFNKIQTFDEAKCYLDVSKIKNKFLSIKKKIYPEFGKIVAFDGKYYHSNKLPRPGKNRIVCVFNLLI